MMKVKSSELVALYVALGYPNAGTWEKDKLESRLEKIESVAEETENLDQQYVPLLEDILAAQKSGDPIEIEGGTATTSKPAKKEKPAPAGGKKSAGGKKPRQTSPEAKDTSSKKSAGKPAKKGKPKKLGSRGVGIIATMIDTLKTGSKKKPVTRKDVLAALKKKFPDRDEEGMAVTVGSQLPTRLRKRKGLNIKDNGEGGYWLEKSEA